MYCVSSLFMPLGRSIFDRVRLRPSQLRTVADRRFDDAILLVNSGHNARANGAMYLGGFVIECLLKAALLEKYGWLQITGSAPTRSSEDQRLWSLCYRLHDLDRILALLPEIQARLSTAAPLARINLLPKLKSSCANWTIFARYSPHSAIMAEAEDFLATVKELKPWLR